MSRLSDGIEWGIIIAGAAVAVTWFSLLCGRLRELFCQAFR